MTVSDPAHQGRPKRRDTIITRPAYAMKGDEKAFAAGCDGYMSKPIDTDALPRMVAGHLAHRVGRGV